MNTLKGKRLCVHFDGKRVKELQGDLNVEVERIAVSVTSPDLDDTGDLLLGVVQTKSASGVSKFYFLIVVLKFL